MCGFHAAILGADAETSAKVLTFRRGKGSRLVGGSGLVVFPRPDRPQFEKAVSQDPVLSWDPSPCPFPERCREGGVPERKGGPGSKGGRGPGSQCSSACAGPRRMGIPRAGSPNEPGPLAFSQLSCSCNVKDMDSVYCIVLPTSRGISS